MFDLRRWLVIDAFTLGLLAFDIAGAGILAAVNPVNPVGVVAALDNAVSAINADACASTALCVSGADSGNAARVAGLATSATRAAGRVR